MSCIETPALPQVHLAPGELLVTRDPQIVVTVLGSCVAVTMFDRESSLAAICHAMLVEPQRGEWLLAGDPLRFRYVNIVVPAMVDVYRRAGIDPYGIEVKIFGGGNVIGRARRGSDAEGIGDANISAVRAQLARADLLVTAESIGGRRGCKILFNTATGDVLRKYLRSMTTRA